MFQQGEIIMSKTKIWLSHATSFTLIFGYMACQEPSDEDSFKQNDFSQGKAFATKNDRSNQWNGVKNVNSITVTCNDGKQILLLENDVVIEGSHIVIKDNICGEPFPGYEVAPYNYDGVNYLFSINNIPVDRYECEDTKTYIREIEDAVKQCPQQIKKTISDSVNAGLFYVDEQNRSIKTSVGESEGQYFYSTFDEKGNFTFKYLKNDNVINMSGTYNFETHTLFVTYLKIDRVHWYKSMSGTYPYEDIYYYSYIQDVIRVP